MSEQASGGYIRLYRKLLENPVWTVLAPAVLKVMLACLLKANWKPSTWYDGQGEIPVPRGSFITSYATMAKLCRLSIKQVRGSFEHLQRAKIASFTRAYTRAQRGAQDGAQRGAYPWTMVTVLNYGAYQTPGDDEGSAAGKPRDMRKSGQEGNNRRSKKKQQYTPYPLKGAGNAIPSEPAKLPFTTPVSQFPADTINGKNGHNGRAPTNNETLEHVACEIHARHPNGQDPYPNAVGRRDISRAGVRKKLSAILKHQRIPRSEDGSYLLQINRNHAGMCASREWTKEGGQFAKGLDNWLAPTKERYLVEPGPPPAPAVSIYSDWEPPAGEQQ